MKLHNADLSPSSKSLSSVYSASPRLPPRRQTPFPASLDTPSPRLHASQPPPRTPPFLLPAVLTLLGVTALALSSRLSLPLPPVPMTLQSLAVLLLGFGLGSRLGPLVVLAWLLAALAGLPVLTPGREGLTAFTGPTAGYLLAFPLAAFAAGRIPRGRTRVDDLQRLLAFLLLHGLMLALGAAWLALQTSPQKALDHGVLPFLPGALAKSLLAALAARGLLKAYSGLRIGSDQRPRQ